MTVKKRPHPERTRAPPVSCSASAQRKPIAEGHQGRTSVIAKVEYRNIHAGCCGIVI